MKAPETGAFSSPDWTRTSNPSINSRMLCQLSYGGLRMLLARSEDQQAAGRRITHCYPCSRHIRVARQTERNRPERHSYL